MVQVENFESYVIYLAHFQRTLTSIRVLFLFSKSNKIPTKQATEALCLQ